MHLVEPPYIQSLVHYYESIKMLIVMTNFLHIIRGKCALLIIVGTEKFLLAGVFTSTTGEMESETIKQLKLIVDTII